MQAAGEAEHGSSAVVYGTSIFGIDTNSQSEGTSAVEPARSGEMRGLTSARCPANTSPKDLTYRVGQVRALKS